MGISTTTNRVVYAGDGSSTVFPFAYEFFNQADLKVYLYSSSAIYTQTLNTHYTIGGTPNLQGVYTQGGNVITTCSIPTNTLVVITRDPSLVQNYALLQNGNINSVALVQQLDYLTLLEQRRQDYASRTMRLQDGSNQGFDPQLPLVISASSVLITNSTASGWTQGPQADQIFGAQSAAISAAASMVAAAASAASAQSSATSAGQNAILAASAAVSAGNSVSLIGSTAFWGATAQSSALSATNNAVLAGSSALSASNSATSAGSSALSASNSAASAGSSALSASNNAVLAGSAALSASNSAAFIPATLTPQYGVIYACSATQFAVVPSATAGAPLLAQGSSAPVFGGTLIMPLAGNQIQGDSGTLALPGYAFRADPSSGMWRIGAAEIAISCSNAIAVDILNLGSGLVNLGLCTSAISSSLIPVNAARNQNGVVNYQWGNNNNGTASVTNFQIYNGTASIQNLNLAVYGNAYTGNLYLQQCAQVQSDGNLLALNISALYAAATINFTIGTATAGHEAMRITASSVITNNKYPLVISGSSGSVSLTGPAGINFPITFPAAGNGAGAWTNDGAGALAFAAGASGTLLTANGSSAPTFQAATVAALGVVSKNTNYNMATTDNVVLVSSSGFQVNLPAANVAGRQVIALKTDTVGGNIVIAGSSATIQGSSVILRNQYDSVSLVADGANWQVNSVVRPNSITILSTKGGGTYVPPAYVKTLWVRGIGGGGGGGGTTSGVGAAGAGGGGGGGGYFEKILAGSALLTSYIYIVGAGGPGGASGNNAGIVGSSTIFGSSVLSVMSATGGGAGGGSGTSSTPVIGGAASAAGTASGGDLNIAGSDGLAGLILAATQATSGQGGCSNMGNGGTAQTGTAAGANANNYGAGGGGGVESNNGGAQIGGNGSDGVIIIHERY